MSKDSFKFLTNYLATFSGEEAHVLSEAKEEAVRAIVDFVKAPDVFQVTCVKMRIKLLHEIIVSVTYIES
jgi:translation initiation factor 3 subunit M